MLQSRCCHLVEMRSIRPLFTTLLNVGAESAEAHDHAPLGLLSLNPELFIASQGREGHSLFHLYSNLHRGPLYLRSGCQNPLKIGGWILGQGESKVRKPALCDDHFVCGRVDLAHLRLGTGST